ncbi:cobyrinate a,c-diamide synthase [Novosphingobium beihaiensis]|uniref:Cobyrinate a,c-diamide synthase n=1 Tax=Novosphingobium beihaiensis TaxID=2930389 RepID=A0ABT0BQK7_9SPHN|nr:cobyrinate a,c-diamide synthase [Novosphingobium beihaiensis]MCJ2187143.1 cobyrinate a,c-diamide synthase [Novosphingobium beihaiensis]
MTLAAHCPAFLVSAPASGQGKTLVTAALARLHRKAGRRVRVFKCGPDFLDPMILERASGAPVHQLDLFMVGEDECRRLLHEAAGQADVILVEGVMGLYDGDPSAADLAACFGLPVLAVIDGSAMAQTFGALALGLATYRPDMNLAAVLANRVGSERHAQMLEESLPPSLTWLGALPRNSEAALPERHLGLVQAGEVTDLAARLERATANLPASAAWLPAPVAFAPPPGGVEPDRPLEGVRIAIARDAAFGFIYPANLACLETMGAALSFFSPLEDACLPECDALWLPGGYPELHLEALTTNRAMIEAVHRHHAAGKAILAECGGMLYCLDELEDRHGSSARMAGLMPGKATMQPRLAALGLQQAGLPGGTVRGHTFHYSRLQTALEPEIRASAGDGRQGEAVFRNGSLTASYVHFYFPSSRQAVAQIFRRCEP